MGIVLDIYSAVLDNLNSIATVSALFISSGSLVLQYLRNRRSVGKLDLIEMYNPKFWHIYETVYGEEKSNTKISVKAMGRNLRDGVLRIYTVKLDIDEIDYEIELTPSGGYPIEVQARGEFDKILSKELNVILDDGNPIEGTVTFETSNNNPSCQVSLVKK